jgi:TfoX/Sxy family transcriptional regulator of competence genes
LAHDEQLAERVRGIQKRRRGLSEKKMFGGLSFLLNGNMCCGIVDDRLMVRVGPDAYETALPSQHATEMDFTGKPLTGYVYVSPAGIRADDDLRSWVEQAIEFARSLPAK